MEPEYNITPIAPEKIPSRTNTFYAEYFKILNDFLNSNEQAISIDASNTGKKISSIYIGLRKVMTKQQLDEKIKIKLNKVSETIYIKKI